MKKTMLILGFVLMVVMLGGWRPLPPTSGLMSSNASGQQAPAAAGDPELVVNNLTGTAFYMTLTGPQTYSVHVLAGKNTFVVVKGEYTLAYFACGAEQTKEVNVKKGGASIKLVCETDKGSSGKTPKLTIDNKTAAFYITFTGPKSYSFYAPPGKTDFEVEPGTYEISYYACGAQISETIVVKKKGGTLKIQCITVNGFDHPPVDSIIPVCYHTGRRGRIFYQPVLCVVCFIKGAVISKVAPGIKGEAGTVYPGKLV